MRRICAGIELARWSELLKFRVVSAPELNNESRLAVQEAYTLEEVSMAKKAKSNRELIDTGNDKRFVRRDDKGRFEKVVDIGRSLARDRKQEAQTTVPPGQGDRGDQKRK